MIINQQSIGELLLHILMTSYSWLLISVEITHQLSNFIMKEIINDCHKHVSMYNRPRKTQNLICRVKSFLIHFAQPISNYWICKINKNRTYDDSSFYNLIDGFLIMADISLTMGEYIQLSDGCVCTLIVTLAEKLIQN